MYIIFITFVNQKITSTIPFYLRFIFAFSLYNIQPLEFEFAIFLVLVTFNLSNLSFVSPFLSVDIINILLPSLGNSTIMLLVVNDFFKKSCKVEEEPS